MELIRKIRVVFKDKLVAVMGVLSLGLMLAAWSLFLLRKVNYSELSVIHSNIYLGIDVLAHWRWFFLIPGLVFLVSILDFMLALYLWVKNRLWTYYLLVSIFFINFLLFIYLYNIINFNLI